MRELSISDPSASQIRNRDRVTAVHWQSLPGMLCVRAYKSLRFGSAKTRG
jgi:hypothetical protein